MRCLPLLRTGSILPSWIVIATLSPLWLGGHTKKLNAPLPGPGSNVVDCLLDPSGTRAVYVADQDVAGVRELYSVPLDQSSPPMRLNDPMPASGDVVLSWYGHNMDMSATGRVLYRADALTDETFELFSVPADGSAPPVRLNATLVSGGDVVDWVLSPDGTRVVYLADQTVDEGYEPFSVPVDGSAPPVALHPGAGSSTYLNAWIGPNGSVIYSLFRPYTGASGAFELYGVPIDGSLPPALIMSNDLGTFWEADQVVYLAFSPDGQHFVFTLRHTDFQVDYISGWVAATDGSDTPQLLPPDYPLITGDGTRVVYRSTMFFGASEHHLYSRTLAGVETPLDDIEEYAGAVILGNDGATVFYVFPSGLYRVPADGSAAPTLLAAPPGFEWGHVLVQSPDGGRLVWLAEDLADHFVLRSIPSTGGTPVVLAELQAYTEHIRFSPDSRHVLVQCVAATGGQQLLAIPADGSSAPRRVHPRFPPGGTIKIQAGQERTFWAATNESVIYIASQESLAGELFLAPLRPERALAPANGPVLPPSPGRY